VKSSTKIAVANALMGVGILPMLLWFAMLVNAIDHLRSGEFGLPDLMFTGVAGMGAYLFTLVVAGAGAIWAGGIMGSAGERARRVAKWLVAVTAAVLILPWGGVLVLVVSRIID
jgi:hypothetical protein